MAGEGIVLNEVSVHFIGNKALEENIILSNKPLTLEESLADLITEGFFKKLSNSFEEYAFYHESSLDYNEVYNFTKDIFNGKEDDKFHENTESIAKHLFAQSTHPNIKPGELYVCYFEDYKYDGAYVDAIGIFKTESKSAFIEVVNDDNRVNIVEREGVDVSKIDKGCLIINTNEDEGFIARVFDNQSKNEAQYWVWDFLGLKATQNEFSQTKEFLGITKQFIAKQIDEEYEISKTDKIHLLNKSVDYFKTHDEFTKDEFEQEVFGDSDLIESFNKFDDTYRKDYDMQETSDGFEISAQAVKKQANSFKSVLKLDKNFHIYIHGDRNKIQKGEENGMKYYKVFYDEEK